MYRVNLVTEDGVKGVEIPDFETAMHFYRSLVDGGNEATIYYLRSTGNGARESIEIEVTKRDVGGLLPEYYFGSDGMINSDGMATSW